MARYVINGSDTVVGTRQNDVYVIDPDNLGVIQITDRGGDGDMLTVYDRPGRTAGEFLVDNGALIWRNYEGDEVRFLIDVEGSCPIEFFRWIKLPEDGAPYSHILKVVLSTDPLTETNVAVAGTAGADRVEAPRFTTIQDGWSDVYGNLGNDTLIGSDNHAYYLYGGRGNDLIVGQGNFGDYFYGDQGNDVVRGLGGDDGLNGGLGNDQLYGGNGNDSLAGGKGDDTVNGGAGADVFQYNPKEIGIDSIVGYGTGDKMQFIGIAAAKVSAVQIGDDVHVTIGTWATVMVEQTQLANLVFDFV